MKVHLKSAASLSRYGEAFGIGRVYQTLRQYAPDYGVEITPAPDAADIQVTIDFPESAWESHYWVNRENHAKTIFYTVWETTVLPTDWVKNLNRFLAVFVPSTWCKDVFEKCGVEVPIYVVPHGVDKNCFPYLERDWDSKDFVFMWQGQDQFDRKGREFALKAFVDLNLPNTKLYQKLYPVHNGMEFGAVPVLRDSDRIWFVSKVYSRTDYMKFLQMCHVSVNPYRGEGFGMMPLETASTGMATLLTDWSAPTDYIRTDPSCFRPLKYRLCEPGHDFVSTSPRIKYRTPPGQDALVDMDDLKEAMLWAYENRTACREMGIRASRMIEKHWSWQKATRIFVDQIAHVLSQT